MPSAAKDSHLLIDEIIPSDEVEKLELGRTAEIIQPLRDLGYIQTSGEAAISKGMRAFRLDYLALDLIPDFSPKFLFLPEFSVESEELDLLHTLTAMDGDYTIEILPKIGESNLISRMIHYRLMIHELIDFEVEAAFSSESMAALNRPKDWIDNLPDSPLDMINLLGDIPTLIQHITNNKNGKLNRKIVVFKYQKTMGQVSRFAPLPQSEAMKEVEEDTDDFDPDDKAEAQRLEKEMLQLETNIEEELDQLKQQPIFDPKEQEVLAEDAKKNKKKWVKHNQVNAMLEKTHGEIVQLNEQFNAKSKELLETFKNLEKIQNELQKEHDLLKKDLEFKQDILNQQSNIDNDISKKQKHIQQLNSKNKTKKRRKKIEELLEDINTIQAQRITSAKMQKIEFEVSDLNVRLIALDAQLAPVKRKAEHFKKAFDKHVDNREDFLSDKQKEILKIQAQLRLLQVKIDKLKFSFRTRMRRALDDDFYDNVVRKEIFQRRNRTLLNDFSEDAYNKYLIRLIQVFQWTNGYYYGKLDSEVGDRTFSALDDMSDYSRKLRLKFILSKLSDRHDGSRGFWILNVKYLLDKLADIIAEQSKEVTTRELLEKYEEEFQGEDEDKARIGNEAMDRGYREIVEENEEDLKEHGGAIRRIYYGIRSIARTLIKAFADIIQILKRGIKRLIYLVKNLVKIVYKEIREGVRKFGEGMQFLFGHRIFQTITHDNKAIYTKFDFDFDTLSYVPDQTTQLERISHTQQLVRATSNLDFALVLTARVLKWTFKLIEAGTPLGWAKLAIRIAINYKRMMIRWLVKLGKFVVRRVFHINYRPAAV
jgi:hypothetical protein